MLPANTSNPLPAGRPTVMNTQEVCDFLGVTEAAVRYAAARGWLQPLRQGRRCLYFTDQVLRYKNHVTSRFPVKVEAQELSMRFPTKPPETTGKRGPRTFTRRDWEMFVAYAAHPATTYRGVAADFGTSGQYVARRINRVIEVLAALAAEQDG